MAAWPLEIEPSAARGRRWRWRRWTTQGSRRCRARSTWRRPRLQKPKLALATACGHGHVPGVRGVPGVPGHGCRRLRGASVPRWASCRAHHLPTYTQVEERVRFILHQKLGKPQHDSQNTTTTPASPARARVEERPDHKRGPITTERPGAKGPGERGLVRWGLVQRGLVRRYRPDHHREAWCGGARRLHSGPAGRRGLDRCAEEAQKTCEPATPRVGRLV